MRVQVLQQAQFEGPGYVADWCRAKSATMAICHVYENVVLPSLDDFDLLVVLGGPMSVNDEGELPWLAKEKELVRKASEAGKSVLGICLGSQLIASALGAKVFRNSVKEIGWFPVTGFEVPAGVFQFPRNFDSFHWHGETFDLPAGAIHLASTPGCKNQAFQFGDKTIALQFHLEATPPAVEAMLAACRKELVPATYIQSESEIRRASPERYAAVNQVLDSVLDYLS